MNGSLCSLGLMEYQAVYKLQTRLVEYRRNLKPNDKEAGCGDIFLVVEHPPVYTLGRRGGREFLMVSDQFLAEKNIPVIPIERGGVITYHGPGQLVIYPIIHLKQAALTVTEYVEKLEELMIHLAAGVGVTARRDERNHGVWVGNKKMGSIGIAIRHGVSFHGLALNVNPSLEPFGWINPCGLTGVSMTSLAHEVGREVTIRQLTENLSQQLERIFPHTFTEIRPDQLPLSKMAEESRTSSTEENCNGRM